LADKLDAEDKKTLKNAVKETQEWIDSNANAEKEQFEE